MFNKLFLVMLTASALFFAACDDDKDPTPQDCVIRDAEVVDEPCEGDDCPDCEGEDCEVAEEPEEEPVPEEEAPEDADEESEAGTEVLPG